MASGVGTGRVRDLLAAAGHAWTRPREGVLGVLAAARSPITAEEIHAALPAQAHGARPNLASVYRTINLLRALRLVRVAGVWPGARRYELAEEARGHRDHLICETCGRIEPIFQCPIDGLAMGPGVRAHHLELYGSCRRCLVGEAHSGGGPRPRPASGSPGAPGRRSGRVGARRADPGPGPWPPGTGGDA